MLGASAACPGPGTAQRGGGGGDGQDGTGTGGSTPPAPSGHVVVSDIAPISIRGNVVAPAAMSMPAMVRVVAKKSTTLAKQRKLFAATTGERIGSEGRVLATMLWDESRRVESDEQALVLRGEMRTVLQAVRAELGDLVDAITLQMLFSIERWLGDDDAAIAAGAEIMQRFPESKSAEALAPWLAFLHLTVGRNTEAAAVVDSWAPAAFASNATMSYVASWVALRRGDEAAARGLIIDAVRGWQSATTMPTLQVEVAFILARTGTAFGEASAIVREMAAGDPELEYILWYKLYEAYDLAGYGTDAIDALDGALETPGKAVPPTDRVLLLVRQANALLQVGSVSLIAGKYGEVVDALAACDSACGAMSAEIAAQLGKVGVYVHTIYSTTQDDRYYTAAAALYALYVSMELEDSATYEGYVQQLSDTRANMAPGSGTHDSEVIGQAVTLRASVAKACYEAELQRDPSMSGSISLELVIGADGRVAEVGGDFPLEPAGMKAVTACLSDRAQTWVFPARSKPGTTTSTISYELAPTLP